MRCEVSSTALSLAASRTFSASLASPGWGTVNANSLLTKTSDL